MPPPEKRSGPHASTGRRQDTSPATRVTARQLRARPPAPPDGLKAVKPNDWIQIWRRVRVQPKAEVAAFDGESKVKVTTAVKMVGLAGCTFAQYEDGTRVRPGNEVLAAITGLNARTVGEAVRTIRQLGFWWQYIDGSGQGRRGIASEYRLTIPADLFDRIPLLTPELDGVAEPGYHPMPDQVISDQVISDAGTQDLRCRNTGSEIPPPLQDPPPTETHTDSAVDGSVEGVGSGEGKPETDTSRDSAGFNLHTRKGTEQARQAAANALREWERQQAQS
jgi:hypothetical protein